MRAHPNPRLTILYRGPLASCDYDCPYCPFANRHDPPDALRADRAALARFVGWASSAPVAELSVFVTPWGEALVRRWYREALATLSHLPGVRRVAIQTNLSARVDWVADADPGRLALWCTYHPGEIEAERFLRRTRTSGATASGTPSASSACPNTSTPPGGCARRCRAASTCG